MASCILTPTVTINGIEKDSKLWQDLMALTDNREVSKAVYSATKSKVFMNALDDIQYDDLGEPTVESLDKALDIASLMPGGMTIKMAENRLNAKDKDGNPVVHKTLKSIEEDVLKFNETNESLEAGITYQDNGYVINVKKANELSPDNKQKLAFQSELNNRLLGIMRGLGFDVDRTDSIRTKAMFAPQNAETNAEGLRTIIKIAKGVENEKYFPEEFAHFMIEGLASNPLVVRLLDSIKDEDIIREILGDDYEKYLSTYDKDMSLMQKEAAGKLLQSHLTGEYEAIDRKPLLQRIFDFIKNLFSNTSERQLDEEITNAHSIAEKASKEILSESIIPSFSKENLLKSRTLYNLDQNIKKTEELLEKMIEINSRKLNMQLKRSYNTQYDKTSMIQLKEITELVEKKEYALSTIKFLENATKELTKLNDELNATLKYDSSTSVLRNIKFVASTLRRIKQFSDAYTDIVNQLRTTEVQTKQGNLAYTPADAKKITDTANVLSDLINQININYKNIEFDLVYKFCELYWSGDQVIPFGNDAGKALTLKMILSMGKKDINIIDRYIGSMSDASDPMLSLVDKIVKATQNDRDELLESFLNKTRSLQKKLEKAGYTANFMYERDSNGKLTGRIISDIDFVRFNEDREAYKAHLLEQKMPWYKVNAEMEKWDMQFCEKEILDPNRRRFEWRPRKDIYGYDRKGKKIDVLERLAPAQREYYDEMLKLKIELDLLLPYKYVNTYNAVQIRDDAMERVIKGSFVKNIYDSVKDTFTRRIDDVDFGYNEAAARGEKEIKRNIELDFNGEPIQQIPIYYTTKLENMDRLSTDFTGTLMAYAGMAVNYYAMNEVVDALELTRNVIKEREMEQYSGSTKLTETFKILHKVFHNNYTKKGENINAKIDSYYERVIYGKKKNKGDTWKILGKEINSAKAFDALKDYTGALGLGLNLFSNISNVTMGNLQSFIDSVAGEYFTVKDLAKAQVKYFNWLPSLMAETGSAETTNILGLLIEKFDALEEFYAELRAKNYYNGTLSRVIGEGSIFLGQNIGEHYLHAQNMLAILNNVKVINKDGEKVSLLDQFETKRDEEGAIKLVLKRGTKDVNGNLLSTEELDKDSDLYRSTAKNFSRFISNQKMRIGKVNQKLNGAFNEIDKGEIHRYALGRLAMQFRQWMPAHYYRRFATQRYDARLGEYVEGYYLTLGRFMVNMMKDIRRGKFEIATRYNQLTSHERANLRRSMTELTTYLLLCGLIALLGPEKDRKGKWGERMVSYQLKRLKLETGASIPWLSLIDNAFTLIQSPAASINTFNNMLDLLKVWNIGTTIQTGRYKGWDTYVRDLTQTIPLYAQINRVFDLKNEDYLFTLFN